MIIEGIEKDEEKFRYDKEISTAKKSKSVNSSNLISNMSLSDVFESTEKKLLNRNSAIFSAFNSFNNGNFSSENIHPEGGVIIEEDSNFNLNTFNVRTNINNNNFDFEFEEKFEQDEIQDEIQYEGDGDGDGASKNLNKNIEKDNFNYLNDEIEKILIE